MKTFTLLKASIAGNTWLSKGGIKELKRQDRLWLFPLALLGVVIAGSAFLFILIQNYRALLYIGIQVGHPELLFFAAVLAEWILIFLFGIPLVLSLLYFTNDTPLLLTLPVSNIEMVSAKTLLLYLYNIPLHLLFFVPAVAVYINSVGFSWSLILPLIFQGLTIPLFPLALSVLAVSGLMKLVNLSRMKTAIEVIGMSIVIIIIISAQFLLGSLLDQGSPAEIMNLGGAAAFIQSLFHILIPLDWIAKSFLSYNPLFMLYSLLFSLGSFFFILFLVGTRFMVDLSRRSSVRGSTKRKKLHEMRLPLRSPLSELTRKEFSILGSQSIFIFESAGELLILPIMLVIFSFTARGPLQDYIMPMINAFPYKTLTIYGVCILFMAINTFASTSVSREGALFKLSLTLPVSGKTHARAKLYSYLILFYPSFLLNIGILWMLFRFSLSHLIYLIPGGVFFSVLIFMGSSSIDFYKPLLNWTHPQQANKQNMNALIGMGIGLLIVLAAGGLCIGIITLGASQWLTGLLITITAAVCAVSFLPLFFHSIEEISKIRNF